MHTLCVALREAYEAGMRAGSSPVSAWISMAVSAAAALATVVLAIAAFWQMRLLREQGAHHDRQQAVLVLVAPVLLRYLEGVARDVWFLGAVHRHDGDSQLDSAKAYKRLMRIEQRRQQVSNALAARLDMLVVLFDERLQLRNGKLLLELAVDVAHQRPPLPSEEDLAEFLRAGNPGVRGKLEVYLESVQQLGVRVNAVMNEALNLSMAKSRDLPDEAYAAKGMPHTCA